MSELNIDLLKAYRTRTYHLPPAPCLTTPAQAVDFVNERGFIHFWPIKGIDLPSLWVATAGDRPVPNEHDDPGHITWSWKDDALDKKVWYYGKVLRRRATLISLKIAPYFYALSENYGSPEEDYILAYEEGRMTIAAKLVYEALLRKGPLDTISLRREARLTSKESDSEFNRALESLQADFKILPVRVAEAGSWRYAFVYDIVARYYPEFPTQAREIGEAEARRKLMELYFQSVGAAQVRDVEKIFGWPPELVSRTLNRLVKDGSLKEGLQHPCHKGNWIALADLCSPQT